MISSKELLETDFNQHVSPNRKPTDSRRFNDGQTEYGTNMRESLMRMKILELEAENRSLREYSGYLYSLVAGLKKRLRSSIGESRGL